ncbi:hypothetical protein CR194_18100 [Salipaludibacillus keqinensis]|uniref:Uncharacterized protein n=1 Tax=Salipaludibacillus keqinensis TaxID=2045207 RepID=A0A323THK6_9BACI|nr:hypothetical protein [Salipaludibacillus keqinensis]PYZ92103.1 hypothetical protein CR194_18100 [Salipaludibacillus keqinensis]
MSKPGLNTLKPGANYFAKELDSFVSSTDVVLLSTNDSQIFSDPERQYKVIHEFDGFFEHSSDDGEKYFREKKAYVVEKV